MNSTESGGFAGKSEPVVRSLTLAVFIRHVEGAVGNTGLRARRLGEQHQAVGFPNRCLLRPRPGVFLWWSWGRGAAGAGRPSLGQDPRPHGPYSAQSLAPAPGLGLPWGLRPQRERAVRVLPAPPWCPHRVLSRSHSCGFIPSGLLFAF